MYGLPLYLPSSRKNSSILPAGWYTSIILPGFDRFEGFAPGDYTFSIGVIKTRSISLSAGRRKVSGPQVWFWTVNTIRNFFRLVREICGSLNVQRRG